MAQHSIPAYEQDSISLPAGTHYRIRYKASPMERGLALHYHDHFEAFFAISDNIPYTVQGRQYTLETGNLLLIAPLALHQPCAQPGMCALPPPCPNCCWARTESWFLFCPVTSQPGCCSHPPTFRKNCCGCCEDCCRNRLPRSWGQHSLPKPC